MLVRGDELGEALDAHLEDADDIPGNKNPEVLMEWASVPLHGFDDTPLVLLADVDDQLSACCVTSKRKEARE